MKVYKKRLLLTLSVILPIAVGCVQQEAAEIPDAAKDLESLVLYTVPVDAPHTIELERQIIFIDKDVLLGSINGVAVDVSGNVYIGDNTRLLIHVFDSAGDYVTAIGGEGSGPGEFRIISQLSIRSGQLYVYDPLQLRMNIFSLDPSELYRTINVSQIDRSRREELSQFNINRLLIIDEESFLVGYSSAIISDPSHPRYNLDNHYTSYYLANTEGEITSEEIFKKQGIPYLQATIDGELRYTAFEFSGRPLMAISGDGHIYTARTNDFLVKKYNRDGAYLHAFYYDVYREKFDSERALLEQERWEHPLVVEHRQSVIRRSSDQHPESWPVLGDMIADDENRLWISTIVENKEVYEWWVLNPDGEQLARFNWPRNRSIAGVYDGHVYAVESDELLDTKEVVRYKFEIK